jgi:hypothetical protein
LQNGRYIAMGLRNQERVFYQALKKPTSEFTPQGIRGVGTR